MDAFVSGLLDVFTYPTFLLMLLGIALGFVVGILPGIGSPGAMAIMLPFIFAMKPLEAFAFLLGMYAVTATTGDITSILFGVPGEAVSAATIIDGHPMAKHGEAGRALGAALMSSLVGAIIGAFTLAAAIPIVTPVVLAFKSPEFLALALLGITFLAALSGENKLKGMLAGGLGLIIAMIGLDPQENIERYTFGLVDLWEGVGIVAAVVGLFAIPEIVELWVKGTSIAEIQVGKLGGVWQGIKDTFIHLGVTVRCSMIGTFFGLVPGISGALSQWVSYGHAVQSASDKSRFGKGDVRGVLGPGAANNSGIGAAMIPTLAFGVPGSATTAILLGAFLIQGLQPGPKMLTENLSLIFSMVWLIVVSNIITVTVCLLFLNQLARITQIRGALLIPVLLALVFFGGYADTNSYLAMAITLIFGVIGLIMVHQGWPRPPMVLGLVLGRLIERNLFISYNIYQFGFLLRPIVLVIIAIAAAVLFLPNLQEMVVRRGVQKEKTVVANEE
ncbi:MAG TPA: tripartite tricarboxylate transporter permease [Candidatus Binatia bacterium]|nr:tripartite tricarboxylate transporter permease [Candidatus Binatia bacterium]